MITEKTLLEEGKKISYNVSGEGMPVVLLHGFAEDNTVWRYQQQELSKHYKLIIPDLPGSGKSELMVNVSIESMANVVKNILDAEHITSVVVIGHSMGGYITLALADQYPAMIKAFGLFHSSAQPDNEEKKAARQRSIQFIRTYGSYEFLKQSIPNLFSEQFRTDSAEIVREMIEQYKDFNPVALIAYYEAMIQRPDRTHVLKSFPRPVLFMIGRRDSNLSLEQVIRQSSIPLIADIHILEHSGHMGMWEETKKANKNVLDFLQYLALPA